MAHPIDSRAAGPPEAIEAAAIGIEAASGLMERLGFIAFRTPPGEPMPDSCLMAVIRDRPSREHFDPEAASFWIVDERHGRLSVIDRDSTMPVHRRFSWGAIRLVDRFGARNGFVGFGGTLDAERVGPDARLMIFRSPAPILRLPGHSQQADRLAQPALAFFGRLVPHLWDAADSEAWLDGAGPEALHAAFLIDTAARLGRSEEIRDAESDDAAAVRRSLALLGRHRPAALEAGHRLLQRLQLAAA
jgi:hypothetical protein